MNLIFHALSTPQRIEYENAYYQVMNRIIGRRDIFDDDNDHAQFLTTVKEAHTQFSGVSTAINSVGEVLKLDKILSKIK